MKNNKNYYRIAVIILSALVLIESILLFSLRKPPVKKPVKPEAIKGKIAFVLDDWGYSLNNIPVLEQIKYPLTVSVLPNLPYSGKVAREAEARGLEVILHLPIEPHEKYRMEADTILVSMDEAAITGIIDRDLANVTGARGVSNHMGSKGTEDVRTMSVIFRELKRKGMFFMDSVVSPDSVCLDLAHKMHIGFARRDIFIDNQSEPDYIKGQIYKLKTRARVYGQAIGIGHDRKNTLEVLKEVMPQLEKEGYRFVFVSELIR